MPVASPLSFLSDDISSFLGLFIPRFVHSSVCYYRYIKIVYKCLYLHRISCTYNVYFPNIRRIPAEISSNNLEQSESQNIATGCRLGIAGHVVCLPTNRDAKIAVYWGTTIEKT